MQLLVLLFIIVPIVEIFVLLQVGSIIGVLPTCGLILFTAVVGVALLKQQGLSVLNRFQTSLNQGALPAQEMQEGLFLAIGGALLLTPGFVTDAFGFCCLIPVTRRLMIKFLQTYFKGRMKFATSQTTVDSSASSRSHSQGKVYEVEDYRREDDG